MHESAVGRLSSPQLKKVYAIPSGGKVMLMFFDHCGPLLMDWLPRGITVSAVCYGEILEHLSLNKD
jgi:hypothetical protein